MGYRTLYDLRGRQVHVFFNGMRQAGSFSVAVPRGLAPGAYLLSYRAGNRPISWKILVER
jgi:hypothetical protein